MTDIQRDLQKIFEFIVKNKGETIAWKNSDIRNFIRWALYYRKLFIVWAPAGQGQRIAALGVAWRTEKVEPQTQTLTFENTEFGDNLFIYQVIVHPDFANTGTLFQLLSMALWRYPGVERVFWFSEHHRSKKLITISTNKLLAKLARQVALPKVSKYARRIKWVAEAVAEDQTSPTLKFVR